MLLALVYEISGNPLFDASIEASPDRLSEFAQPSEIDDLTSQLRSGGHEVMIVDGPRDLLERHGEILASGAYVFNKSIGFFGLERKIHVPSICLLHGLPLIGSSAYSMTLARHKYHTNRLLAGLGYNVPAAVLWTPIRPNPVEGLRFPVIVKPNHESDALGIDEGSVVATGAEAVRLAASLYERFRQPIVVEEFIPGEEWKVPVIGNSPESGAWGCVSVCRGGAPIIDSLQTRADVVGHSLSYTPVSVALRRDAMEVARCVHLDLGLRDYSRCDFRVDRDGSLRCMEISTHPDLSVPSSFMAAATQAGEDVADVLNEIIGAAKKRYAGIDNLEHQSLQN